MINPSEDFTGYVKARCAQWADWYSRGNFYGLGYPPCSLEYRLLKEGCIRHTQSAQVLPTHEGAEEIEALVTAMSKQNRVMALALRCHYFTTGSLRRQAQRVNLSHTHFKHIVDMAHQWLAGRLSRY